MPDKIAVAISQNKSAGVASDLEKVVEIIRREGVKRENSWLWANASSIG
jgi:hypothetical protein